ncbi:unnamed protein product [Diatraea saccharalis]|uniref:Uncharacterized protein n=1 Tax=Diatraea saccharalis TaxID=40085 RepID=A0A9N9R8G9_9NEOP|nr:unnamed protein product [Diatraea saccharalis]
MKIYQVLCRRNLMPNGHIFRGKDRLVKQVFPKDLRKIQKDFAVEEQNMFFLRHPYLTEVINQYKINEHLFFGIVMTKAVSILILIFLFRLKVLVTQKHSVKRTRGKLYSKMKREESSNMMLHYMRGLDI